MGVKEKKREREKGGNNLSRDIYWQDGAWLVRGVAAGGEREDEEHSSQKEELHVLFLSLLL